MIKKYASMLNAAITGGCCAALSLLAVHSFLRYLYALLNFISGPLGLSETDSAYATAVLIQFKDAVIKLPIGIALSSGVLIGTGLWLLSRRWRKTAIALAVFLFFVLIGVVLYFTQVNGIQIGLFLSALFPLLPHLL